MLRLLGCMLLLLSVVLQLELQLEGLGLGIPIEYVATCKHGTSKGVHPDRHSVAMRKAYRHGLSALYDDVHVQTVWNDVCEEKRET
jgi:hypothetical protein